MKRLCAQQAFTDPNDANAALINTGIILVVAVGLVMVVKGDGDKDWGEEQTQAMCVEVLESMKRVFQVLQDQLRLAQKVIVQQKKDHRREKMVLLGDDYIQSDESSEFEVADSESYVTDDSSTRSSSDFSMDLSDEDERREKS
jgi:uncharacterized membrane protein YdfJ with MMPL/SSD domain